MDEGKLTSVELTKAYIERIEALNKRGPGPERRHAVQPGRAQGGRGARTSARAAGHLLGPAHGLPILMKDLIDVKGMYTSAGNYSLRKSFPAHDAGLAKKLREHGVVILGKLGLSEFANSFGNQPSGFSNLTGQVVNGDRRRPEPERLVVGHRLGRRRGALDADDRHRDLGLDHQPVAGAAASSACGRPSGSSPATASRRSRPRRTRPARWTARVANAALTLQSIAGPDPDSDAEYTAHLRAELPRDAASSRRRRRPCRTTCRRST